MRSGSCPTPITPTVFMPLRWKETGSREAMSPTGPARGILPVRHLQKGRNDLRVELSARCCRDPGPGFRGRHNLASHPFTHHRGIGIRHRQHAREVGYGIALEPLRITFAIKARVMMKNNGAKMAQARDFLDQPCGGGGVLPNKFPLIPRQGALFV